jgi:hypothetical protein
MTPSELKYNIERSGNNPYFFTRKTMSFFGDTMRNYGVRNTTIKDREGQTIPVWELYRKRPVKHGLKSSHYFRQDDFTTAYPAEATL